MADLPINGERFSNAEHYDGEYQAALRPTVEPGERFAATGSPDARQWDDVTRAALAIGCELVWDEDIEDEDDGKVYGVYVIEPIADWEDA